MSENSNVDWSLFKKALKNDLTSGEDVEFDAWLNSSPGNKVYFQKAKAFYSDENNAGLPDETETEKAFQEFKAHSGKRKNLVKPLIGVAASILILSAISILIFNQPKVKIVNPVVQLPIPPGEQKATLTLSNGHKFVMGINDTVREINEVQSLVKVDPAGISYNALKDKLPVTIALNKIEIPHGGEFRVTLSDGTKVWLNSETTMEYPVQFASDFRQVIISGEAFFEVAKNPEKPFIVQTRNMKVEVTGTSFNLSSYTNDQYQVLTLAEGKVRITDIAGMAGQEIDLNPDQQFLFNQEKMTSEIRKVDPSVYSAWTRGSFVFEDEPIEQIFTKLGRWYDISVFYKNEDSKKIKLTGDLPRFENFEIILKLMEEVSHVNFEINGNNIIIK
jgi:transmembrane sensor